LANPGIEIKISRRKMLFQIIRVATSKLIKGEYQYANVSEITTEDLLDRTNSVHPPLIIDTRSRKEFNSGFGHIPNSKLIPLMELVGSFNNLDSFKSKVKELEVHIDEISAFRDGEVITICPGGGFSLVAAEILAEAGFKDVKSLSGGIDEWFMKDYPTSLASNTP
jgi:rhodanese-related sulfurtransferase